MKKILIIILLFSLFITQCLIKAQKKPSLKTTKKNSVKGRPTTRKPTIKITTKKVIKPPTKTTARTTTKSTTKPTAIKPVRLDTLPPYLKNERIFFYFPRKYQNDLKYIFNNLSAKTGIHSEIKYDKPHKNKIAINFNEISNGPNKVNISYNAKIPTEVYLHANVFKDVSKFMFYLGISLSLIPQVSRLDRNKYVEINYNNIKDDFKKYYNPVLISFLKRKSDFDFGSSMIPDQLFGGINDKKPTYTLKYPYNSYQKLSDNNYKYFSHNDYRLLWDFYRPNTCSDKMSLCQNGGYPDQSCEQCECPSYFQGTQCEEIKNNLGYCGFQQIFEATEKLDFLLLKNIGGECYYTIQSKNKKKIKIRVERLIIPDTKCSTDDFHLGILYLNDKGVEPFTICKNTTSLEFSAESSKVFIYFKITKRPNLLAVSFQEVD
uniref:EGF-like domain-containing protein n=1 Tax=Strongyloides venezuelensis TaxID=75913 RepID=A0A0K0FS99_STRVS